MAIEFNMQIIDNFDFIFEEKSNTFGALRKIKWSDNGKEKLDIRTYNINSSGEEVPGKGFRFSTEDGPHELVKIMTEQGYGKTDEILKSIKDRKDFMSSLSKVLSKDQMEDISKDNPDIYFSDTEEDEEDFYDPRELVS